MPGTEGWYTSERADPNEGEARRLYEATVTVCNSPGIHARPAALLVQEASRFEAEITIGTAELAVNGKSIMGVMMLAAETGMELTIRGDGHDERAAVDSLKALIASGFEED